MTDPNKPDDNFSNQSKSPLEEFNNGRSIKNTDENLYESEVEKTHISRRAIHSNSRKKRRNPSKSSIKNTSNEENVHTNNKITTPPKNVQHHKHSHAQDEYSIENFEPKKKAVFSLNVFLNVIGKLIIILLLMMILLGSLGLGTGLGFFANLVSDTPPPTPEEMLEDINKLEQQSTIYYADGTPIADVQTDLVRTVTNLENISPLIIDGIIATEDEYFYDHPGIVPKAILRASLESIFKGSGTGGSTITQQLVKQQMLSNDVTFSRKANEILLALRLENHFSKDDILTAYLNVSPFGRNNRGENVAGIDEAAKGIFGKETNEVSLNQAAFLVGLPQDPYTYTPYDQGGKIRDKKDLQPGIDRMKTVLYRMYTEQKISKEEYNKALEYDITKDFIAQKAKREERMSYLYQTVTSGAIEKIMEINIKNDGYTLDQVYEDPEWYNEYYFAAEAQLKTGGYRVYSTIDKQIYNQLQLSAINNQANLGAAYDGVYVNPDTGEETPFTENVQSSVVVIENKTGRVLGFVAGTDFENNQIDHAFKMRRSPGSTIKPLAVFGPAIEENILNPASIIPDTPFSYQNADGSTWEPTNYGGAVSKKFISARETLKMSYNVPTIRVYQELLNQGVPVTKYLQKMGFNLTTSYTKEDAANLAFSIGGVSQGPTVFEQTRAFSTIANNGQYIEGHYIEKIEDNFGNVIFEQENTPTKVFSEDSNYLLLDMLRDTLASGTATTANSTKVVNGDWIAKTGTSENMKDLWFIGSTPSITIGTWLGYDNRYGDYSFNPNDGYGHESERSQRFWANMVNDLYSIRPDIFGTELTFNQPSSVVETQVVQSTGTLPGTIEYGGQYLSVGQPLISELFKVSNPAPPFTYNFLIGATEQDISAFWSNIQSQYEKAKKEKEKENKEETTVAPTENSETSPDVTTPPTSSVETPPVTPPANPG